MNRQLIDLRDFVNSSPEAVEAELKPASPAVCVACNRYGSLLAVGCQNGDVVLYDMMTRSEAAILSQYSIDQKQAGMFSPVVAVSWSRNGHKLAIATAAGHVSLWNAAESTMVAAHQFGTEVTGVSLASGSDDKLLVTFATSAPLLWVPAQSSLLEVPFPCTSSTRVSGVIEREGRHIVLASDKGVVAVYSGATLALLDALKVGGMARGGAVGTQGSVRGVSVDEKGTSVLLLSPSSIRHVSITPPPDAHAAVTFAIADTCEKVETLKPGTSLRGDDPLLVVDTCEFKDTMDNMRWKCCHLSRDGEYVLGGADAKERHLIYLWDRATGQLLRVLEGPSAGLATAAWHPSPYRQILLSITGTGRVFIWAYIIKENWEVFAPGFRSLDRNVEYVESETEFDLNPDPSKVTEEPVYDDEEIDVVTVPQAERKIFDSDTEEDITSYLRALPLQATPLKDEDLDQPEDSLTPEMDDADRDSKRQRL